MGHLSRSSSWLAIVSVGLPPVSCLFSEVMRVIWHASVDPSRFCAGQPLPMSGVDGARRAIFC